MPIKEEPALRNLNYMLLTIYIKIILILLNSMILRSENLHELGLHNTTSQAKII